MAMIYKIYNCQPKACKRKLKDEESEKSYLLVNEGSALSLVNKSECIVVFNRVAFICEVFHSDYNCLVKKKKTLDTIKMCLYPYTLLS